MFYIRPKKLIMFLRHRLCHLQPPHKKISLHFLYLHLKFLFTSSIVTLIWPPVAAILFVFGWLVDFWCTHWLLHILKVGNFWNLLRYIIFISKSIQKKIKIKSRHLTPLKTMPEKHIINFFGLVNCYINTFPLSYTEPYVICMYIKFTFG